jgi:hypothetical protein
MINLQKKRKMEEKKPEKKKTSTTRPDLPALHKYCSLCSSGELKFSNLQGACSVEKMQKSALIHPVLTPSNYT